MTVTSTNKSVKDSRMIKGKRFFMAIIISVTQAKPAADLREYTTKKKVGLIHVQNIIFRTKKEDGNLSIHFLRNVVYYNIFSTLGMYTVYRRRKAKGPVPLG